VSQRDARLTGPQPVRLLDAEDLCVRIRACRPHSGHLRRVPSAASQHANRHSAVAFDNHCGTRRGFLPRGLSDTCPCILISVSSYRSLRVVVELVGEGWRGGQRTALSTASQPVRCRRIVHKSTACVPVWRCSSTCPCDEVSFGLVPERGAQRQSLIGSPNGCLGAGASCRLQLASSTRMGV
jgi:hypothetical protein